MKRTDQLHELIQSLSKNEKGYFKKYCSIYSTQKDQKYLRLFDLIDREKDYEDSTIIRKFKGELDENKLYSWLNKFFKVRRNGKHFFIDETQSFSRFF